MNHANLWAPWRMAYLRSIAALPKDHAATPKDSNFFRTYWASPEDDEKNLVVLRTDQGMILLNRYPYANGHLLIALGEAAPTLADYDAKQRQIFWTLVDTASRLVRNTLNPQGLNIGVNEGSAAGAGVPEHLHAHVVPRWGGDTNFMTTVGGVRVSPDALESVASAYREGVLKGALDV
jgi:ATP adenylyltransferase